MGLAIGLSISPVIGSLSSIEYILRDQFKSPLAAGSVHNTDATPGPGTRTVKDTETKLSIVNNTASFLNLTTHSWNRQGLYYGPYTRTTGRALAMHFFDSDVQAGVTNTIHLVAGWFISAEPADPTADELCLGIAALVSGSIYLSLRSPIERVRRNTKQVDMFLVAVMRAAGVIYYLTASPNARLLGEVSYPSVMPVGLYNVGTDNLYAGMWATYTQGSAGGSQLRDIAIADIPAWENWYTSASRADTLVGTGDIDGTTDALGNTWSVVNGSVHRSASGAIGNDSGENNYAVITGGNPKGLIAITVKVNAAVKYAFIVFRYQDFDNFFFLYFTATSFFIKKKIAGSVTQLATGPWPVATSTTYNIHIVDDGTHIRAYLDGDVIDNVDGWSDTALNDQGGCGFAINSDDAANIEITNFEAHDFNIPLPAALRIGGPFAAEGSTTVATEDFAGVTADLDGKVTTTGALTWRAEEGRIDLDGSGSAIWVSGDPIYTIPWSSPGFADLQAEITPPGAGYGSGDNCFAGLVCWQDADNWMAARIRVGDDQVNSSEVEIIYCLAASSSVVSRIAMQTELAHGDQDTFRITFNGIDFNAYVDGEVVAYRSLTDLNPAYTALTINRVGIYADSIDNGSLWDNFIAKS